MLIEEFFESNYLPYRPSTSERTVRLYAYSIKKYGEWLGEPARLSHFTNNLVGNYLRHLMADGMKPSSVDKERRQLLAIWRFAHTLGEVTRGPVIGPIKIPQSIPTALTVNEIKRLIEALPLLRGQTCQIPNSDFLGTIIAIQYATAARIGAVTQLRFSDVKGDVITFRAETRKGGRKPIVKAVPSSVIQQIKKISKPRRELIFPIRETNKTKIQTLVRRLFKRAGVVQPEGKATHIFRSSHATHLEIAGGDATKSLGHTNRATTTSHYYDPRHNADRSCDLLPDIWDARQYADDMARHDEGRD